MPFPLAHPAAVLPFRRYCPRLLCLPALVVGSLIPDVGYLGKPFGFDEFTHRVSGLFAFCLPAGIVAVLILFAARGRIAALMPEVMRRVFEPVLQQPPAALRAIVFSVFIGAATHVLWDSFTHEDGWLVGRIGFLHQRIMGLQGRSVRVCHFLSYASSVMGVAFLGVAYQQWRSRVRHPSLPINAGVSWINGLLLGCLVMLVALLHHLLHGVLDAFLSASFAFLLALGFGCRVERQLDVRPGVTLCRADRTSV